MSITKPTEEKLNMLLAVFITLTICVSRISMAVGQAFQCMALLAGVAEYALGISDTSIKLHNKTDTKPLSKCLFIISSPNQLKLTLIISELLKIVYK